MKELFKWKSVTSFKSTAAICVAITALALSGCGSKTEPDTKPTAATAQAAATESAAAASTAQSDMKTGAEGSATLEPGEASAYIEVVSGGSSENAPEDQGATDVWIKGDVTVDGQKLTVNGTTNIVPGAEMNANITAKGYNMWGYNGNAEVEADGGFTIELEKPELKNGGFMDVEISFNPDLQSADIEQYGAEGQKLTGPYIHQYEQNDKVYKKAMAFVHIKADAPNQFKAAIETPSSDKPADYGNPNVWIKPEVTFDDNYYYIKAKSNLLEGTKVTSDVEIPKHWHFGYNDYTEVQPDGSFRLQMPKPKEVGMFYLLINVVPDQYMLKSVAEAYGTKGEKFKGNLVKIDQTNEGQVSRIQLKIKINAK